MEQLQEDFFLAIYRGDVAAAEDLLARGVSPDVRNRIGETALAYAASYGHRNCVELLLRQGASADPIPVWCGSFFRWGPIRTLPTPEALDLGNEAVVAVLKEAGSIARGLR
jgi:ankyrin repeat protein